MVPKYKEFEDYFKERHVSLLCSESDSALVEILKGVSTDASSSDVVVVLGKYDTAAEKVVPGYWPKRVDELNLFLKSKGIPMVPPMDSESQKDLRAFLSANPDKNNPGFENYLNPDFYAKTQVAFYEDYFAGKGETLPDLDVDLS